MDARVDAGEREYVRGVLRGWEKDRNGRMKALSVGLNMMWLGVWMRMGGLLT